MLRVVPRPTLLCMKRAIVSKKRAAPAPVLLLAGVAALAACEHGQKPPSEPSAQAATAKAASGHGSTTAPPPQTGATKSEAPELEPDALAALDRMGATLSSLQEFAVRGETTKDEVLENGQKLQFAKTVDLWVKRPNALRVDSISDRQRRQFFYDGKTFTLYAPGMGYYAQVNAPPTIEALIDMIQDRYDVEMPLVDLFNFGTARSSREAIRSAIVVGPAKIGGAETDQYAYRQDDVDWQIWIEKGERALPRKLVITTRDEPSEPQYVALMTWNLEPKFEPQSFGFVPPAGSQRIVFEADRQPAATPKPSQGAK